MDVARSMLKAKHLPNDYWAEVVLCNVHFEYMPYKSSHEQSAGRSMEWEKARSHPHESFWMCGLCTHSKSAKEVVGQQRGEMHFHWIQ